MKRGPICAHINLGPISCWSSFPPFSLSRRVGFSNIEILSLIRRWVPDNLWSWSPCDTKSNWDENAERDRTFKERACTLSGRCIAFIDSPADTSDEHISYYTHTRVSRKSRVWQRRSQSVYEIVCTETVSSPRSCACKKQPLPNKCVRSFFERRFVSLTPLWQSTNEKGLMCISSSTCNFLEWPASQQLSVFLKCRNAVVCSEFLYLLISMWSLLFYIYVWRSARDFVWWNEKWEKCAVSAAAISKRYPLCTLLLRNSSVLYIWSTGWWILMAVGDTFCKNPIALLSCRMRSKPGRLLLCLKI